MDNYGPIRPLSQRPWGSLGAKAAAAHLRTEANISLKRTSRKSPAAGRQATSAVDARSGATGQRIADKWAAAPAICSASDAAIDVEEVHAAGSHASSQKLSIRLRSLRCRLPAARSRRRGSLPATPDANVHQPLIIEPVPPPARLKVAGELQFLR